MDNDRAQIDPDIKGGGSTSAHQEIIFGPQESIKK